MSKVTLRLINQTLKSKGFDIELVKGKGYFYFIGDKLNLNESTSVMVNSINQLSLNQWVSEAKDFWSKVE